MIEKILRGRSDASIGVEELRSLLKSLGFEERIRGSHHIYRRVDIEERLNLQHEGAKTKPYQVHQVRAVILKYRLGVDDDA
ncbi:type II toxin-antitoxin system HicA family toxin [Nitrosococcus watsonii]|uniref:type II toxin-antitoxin system HicA family toxin n=1 Tax=Nitrosococcus watsonii TaxID=473531 RepID=UPI001E2B7A9C|nr:type II toxin-antitoxin system HicA family toxin [Nitrosococcus watsonii]